jgi:multiple antibiotic resistance protein
MALAMEQLKAFVGCTLYLIAVINPMSKVFILSVMAKDVPPRELRSLVLRSSAVALAILLVFAIVGSPLLSAVFHVEIYSFQIVGGLVLFATGFKALSHGTFYEESDRKSLAEMAIVPLASPMIAGPATITAAMTFPAHYRLSVGIVALAMVVAVGGNLLIMLSARPIGTLLQRHNVMGALIRITGMIVATIAVQMVLTGVAAWHMRLPGMVRP